MGLACLFFVPFALAMSLAILASLVVSLTLIPLGTGACAGTIAGHGRPAAGARCLNVCAAPMPDILDWMLRRPRRALAACAGLLPLPSRAWRWSPMHFLPLPNEGVLLESFALPPGHITAQTRASIRELTARSAQGSGRGAHLHPHRFGPGHRLYRTGLCRGDPDPLKPGIHVNSLDHIARRLLRKSQPEDGVQTQIDTPTIERLGESLSGLPQPFVIHVFGGSIQQLRRLSERIAATPAQAAPVQRRVCQ